MTQPLWLHLRDVANVVPAGAVEVWAAHLLQLRCLWSRRTSLQLDAVIYFHRNINLIRFLRTLTVRETPELGFVASSDGAPRAEPSTVAAEGISLPSDSSQSR